MRLFVLAKDSSGLRALAVHREIRTAEGERARFEREKKLDAAVVAGFDLEDVMRSHPAWFRIEDAA